MNTHTKQYNKKIFAFALITLLVQSLLLKTAAQTPLLSCTFNSGTATGLALPGQQDQTLTSIAFWVPIYGPKIITQCNFIQGTGFNTNTDSLNNISNNTIAVPFGTFQQLSDIQGVGYSSDTNSLHSISTTLANTIPVNLTPIEGNGFDTNINSLVAITNDITTLGTSAGVTPDQITAIEGIGFDTNNNSLVAISNSVAQIPPFNLHLIEGAGFNTTTNSLVAITNDITALGTTTGISSTQLNDAFDQLATSNQLESTMLPLATTSQLNNALNSCITPTDLQNTLNGLATTTQLNSAFNRLATPTDLNTSMNSLATNSQITAIKGAGFDTNNNSLVAISAAVAKISGPDLTPIEGTGFNTNTNSLVAITNDIQALGTTAGVTSTQLHDTFALFSTSQQLHDAASPVATTTQLNTAIAPLATTILLNNSTTNLAQASQITVLNNALSNIQNTVALIIAKNVIDPIAQVTTAKGTTPLKTVVTSSDTTSAAQTALAAYKTALYGGGSYTPSNPLASSALGAINRAIAGTSTNPPTQSYTNTSTAISALNTAITAFNTLAHQWAIDNSGPSTASSAAQIQAALNQLQSTLIYLLSQQSQ